MRVSVSTGAMRLPSASPEAMDLPSNAEVSPVRMKLAQADWLSADFASPAKPGAAVAQGQVFDALRLRFQRRVEAVDFLGQAAGRRTSPPTPANRVVIGLAERRQRWRRNRLLLAASSPVVLVSKFRGHAILLVSGALISEVSPMVVIRAERSIGKATTDTSQRSISVRLTPACRTGVETLGAVANGQAC